MAVRSRTQAPGRATWHRRAGAVAWPWVLSALVATSCRAAPADEKWAVDMQRPPRFVDAPIDSVFQLVDRVELADSDSSLITGIRTIAVALDGRIAIPDRIESQVRVYSRDGALLTNLGRYGEGPGEFQTPQAVAFTSDGALFVSEGGVPRITRYSPALTLDSAFSVPGALMIAAMAPTARGVVVGHLHDPTSYDKDFLAVYSPGGAAGPSFHRVDRRILDVPYWWSILGQLDTDGYLLATSREYVYAGNALVYPIHKYSLDGTPHGTVGTPPPSWNQAPPLERNALAGPELPVLLERYLRSITTIDRIGVLEDSMLLVSHRQLDPEDLKYREATYRLDIYDDGGAKYAEDIRAPGPLLFAGRYAYFLISEAPEPWIIAKYEMRER